MSDTPGEENRPLSWDGEPGTIPVDAFVARWVSEAVSWADRCELWGEDPPPGALPRLAVCTLPAGVGKTRAFLQRLPRTHVPFTPPPITAKDWIVFPKGAFKGIKPLGMALPATYFAQSHRALDEKDRELVQVGGEPSVRVISRLKELQDEAGPYQRTARALGAFQEDGWEIDWKWYRPLQAEGLLPADLDKHEELRPHTAIFAPTAVLTTRKADQLRLGAVDEAPDFVVTATVPVASLFAWTPRAGGGAYQEWVTTVKPAVDLVGQLAELAKEEWRNLRKMDKRQELQRYPHWFYGDIVDRFRGELDPSVLKAALSLLGPPPPRPDPLSIGRGRLTSADHPRGDLPEVLRAALHPGERFHLPEYAPWTHVALRVGPPRPVAKGVELLSGQMAKGTEEELPVALVVGCRWPLRVRHREGLVVLDATGDRLRSAYLAAWAGVRDVAFFPPPRTGRVPPKDSSATTRVWREARASKGSYLYRRDQRIGSSVVANPYPLERWLADGLAACERHLPEGRRPLHLGLIVPLAIRPCFEAAARACSDHRGHARPAGAPSHDEDAVVLSANKFDGVVGRLKSAFDRGLVERVTVMHQLAVRGSNALKDVDGLLLIRGTPDLGSTRFQAYVLGLPEEEFASAVEEAELKQQVERVRTLRATSDKPKLVFYAGPSWNEALLGKCIPLEGRRGGPIPKDERWVVQAVFDAVGCVGTGLLSWLARAVEEGRLPRAEWERGEIDDALADVLRSPDLGALRDGGSTVDRWARDVEGRKVTLRPRNPTRAGAHWTLHAESQGAVDALVAWVVDVCADRR